MRPKNLLLTLSAVIILLFTASLATAAPIGKVTLVTGRVDVLKAGANLATPVKSGDSVDAGDIYRAKTNSTAEITFSNKNILKIAPVTRVEIKEYMVDEQKSSQVVRLHRGKVQAISGEDFIKKVAAVAEGNNFEVHTPNAVAGIRGSNMLVGFSQGKTVVIFITGKGYLYNPQIRQVIIPVVAGQMSFVVGEQQAPSVPTQAPEGLIRGGGEAFIRVERVTTEEKATETEAITTASVVTPPAEAPKTQAEPPKVTTSLIEQESTTQDTERRLAEKIIETKAETKFTGIMSFFGGEATFTASIPKGQSIGTMSASCAYSGSAPTTLEGWLYGTSDKGGAFYGPLAGIEGSWLTRMAALYVEGNNLSLLTGDAPGTYDGTVFAISGSLAKSNTVGTITLTPSPTLLDALEGAISYSKPPQFFPTDTPIIISDSGIQITPSSFRYTAPYLITNEGKKAAVIGNIYTGSYASTTATALPYIGYTGEDEYALGPLSYTHDPANSRFTIDTNLKSIDKQIKGYDEEDNPIYGWYLGTYSMKYFGKYEGSNFRMAGAGTYVGTPLTSSLKLSTAGTSLTAGVSPTASLWRALPGTYYEGEFGQYDGQLFWYEYEYIKTVGGKGYGYVEDDHASDGYYEKIYLPNGTMWKMNGDMQITAWDIEDIEKVRKPQWLNPSELFAVWYSEWPGVELLEHRPLDYLDARLGMTGYPWNTGGTPVTIIGRYSASDSDYTRPTILTTPLLYGQFYTDYVEGGTTPNGAYGVSLGGFIDSTRGVQLAMIGLYTNGSQAGVLRDAQLLKGGLYKDIGMWDAEGTLSATVMKTDFTNPLNNPARVTVANLDQSIVTTPFELEIAGHLTRDPGSLLTTIMDSTGQTHFITGQDWGIYTSAIWSGGFGVTSTPISGTWSTHIVGEGQFGVYKDAGGNIRPDYGMMLIPELAGTLSDGVIKASSTGNVGTFMTMTKMGTISDVGLLGVYTQPSSMTPNTLYSWQGVSGGVWKTTDNLTFVSEFETSVRNLRHEYNGGYIQESGVVYNYSFNKDDGYGEITFFPDVTHPYTTRIVYEPDAGVFSTPIWEKYTYDNTFSEFTYEKGTYKPSDLDHEFFSKLAVEEGYQPANQQIDWWTISDVGYISAIMGGVKDPWLATSASPATVYFLGEYENDYKKPSFFDTEIVSYNITNDKYTTLDGKGAYIGYIGGNEKDGAIEGWLNAIYLKDIGDGKSQAGILSGSFTGQAYNDIEMWQGQGSIYPVSVMNPAIQLSPSGLYENTFRHPLGSHMYGTFNNGAVISGVNNYSLTYAIYNEPWGIYGLRLTEWSKFEAFETLPTLWAAKVGMMGDFGAYKEVKDGQTSITPDEGYWLADISGTLSTGSATTDGKLSGSLTGKYLTNTRLGTMSGDVYGTYNTDSILQMLSLGTWQGTPLTFVSNISSNISNTMVEYIGSYKYTGGGSYSYKYYSDNSYGYSYNYPTSNSSPYTYTEYHDDGTTVTWGNDANGNWFSSSGTWNTTASLADLVKNPTPPSGETATLAYQSDSLILNSIGYMNTRIGGIDSLWTGNDIPVTILGMHYKSGYGDRKPEGIWYSEIKSYNVIDNTNTTLDGQGAYYGYIGGNEKDGKLEGGIGAIYLKKKDDTNSEAGILLGSFTGQAYQEIMMWEGQGTISPPVSLMDNISIPYTNLVNSVHVTDLSFGSGAASLILNNNAINTDSFIYDLHYMALYDVLEGSFGVWQSAIGAYGVDPGASWTASFEYMDSARINGQYITGATSGNIMTGTVVGYGADLIPPQPATWISVGEAKGTFDPNLTTFQMMAIGPSIETNTYLKLVQTNPEALKALNIPAVEVGKVNLSGSWTDGGNSINVNMNDVRFFRATNNSTEAPKVWATNSVGGSYTGTPTNATVNLNPGGSVSANFNVKTWDTSSNKWLATVTNGNATANAVGAHPAFKFQGAAAGTYTGTASGQFSGTAAGVAK